MKYNAKIETQYEITISDPDKFLEYFTSEDYMSVYFDFTDIDEILEHLIMEFDSIEASLLTYKDKRMYAKDIEGLGLFIFDNRLGWKTSDEYLEGCGFSVCISEKETNFDQVIES